MMNKHIHFLGWTTLLVLCLFLSFNAHTKYSPFQFRSELWADKAGYYVYSPAVFIYRFDATQFPDSVDIKTGSGFQFTREGKVATKYPYGVALMQSPFFLMAHWLAVPLGYKNDGFSVIYHRIINVAGVVYLILGLFFLSRFLRIYFRDSSVYLSILLIFLGTNLYYYAIKEGGMSHIYSFCVFSALLFQISRWVSSLSIRNTVLLGLGLGLMIIVRPVNMIFIPALLFVGYDRAQRFNSTFQIKQLLSALVIVMLIVLVFVIPQLLYYKYLTGNYLYNSYAGEGFSNLFQFKLLRFWFSPDNGLFLYNPLNILLIVGSAMLFWFDRIKGAFFLLYFLFFSWITAGWWSWDYGCSYGCRPFVEYLAVFSIPFTFLIEKTIRSRHLLVKILIFFVIAVFVVYNLKMIYTYGGCWNHAVWSWDDYLRMLVKPTS